MRSRSRPTLAWSILFTLTLAWAAGTTPASAAEPTELVLADSQSGANFQAY